MENVLSAFIDHPKGVCFKLQDDDEEVILLLRRHWITNLGWISTSLVLFAFPVIFEWAGGAAFLADFSSVLVRLFVLIWYAVTVGIAFYSFLNWFFNVFIVTDKRVVDVDYWGIWFYRLSDCSLKQIQDITHDIGGMMEVLFNFGDVYVQTAAEVGQFEFKSVPHPAEVHRIIGELAKGGSKKRKGGKK